MPRSGVDRRGISGSGDSTGIHTMRDDRNSTAWSEKCTTPEWRLSLTSAGQCGHHSANGDGGNGSNFLIRTAFQFAKNKNFTEARRKREAEKLASYTVEKLVEDFVAEKLSKQKRGAEGARLLRRDLLPNSGIALPPD